MSPIRNLDTVASPALLFDAGAVSRNLARTLELVGGNPAKLRPHLKTHKCREILEEQLSLGVQQVKCATIAEAELAAIAGVPDILISYPLVGPNVRRFLALKERYPASKFSALVDSPAGLAGFAAAATAPLDLFLDLDCGMHRTGISPGDEALALIQALVEHPTLRFAGIHAYDGHIHDPSLEERGSQFAAVKALVEDFVARVEKEVAPVPLIVSGGSPTFALHAAWAVADSHPHQASPGTTSLWDCGYGEAHPELPFSAAALLLTRVVSMPGEDRLCLDLGHKSVAAEMPLARRVTFPAIPEAEFVSQSEEHLVLRVANRERWPVGTEIIGIPRHVCPTVALHQQAHIVRDGAVTGEIWKIAARDRTITI